MDSNKLSPEPMTDKQLWNDLCTQEALAHTDAGPEEDQEFYPACYVKEAINKAYEDGLSKGFSAAIARNIVRKLDERRDKNPLLGIAGIVLIIASMILFAWLTGR